jgi:hypothetical protein
MNKGRSKGRESAFKIKSREENKLNKHVTTMLNYFYEAPSHHRDAIPQIKKIKIKRE